MAIRVRSITAQESEILDRWQRCDDIVRYRRARVLRLSETDWRCPAIAEVLALHVETVRLVIKAFNEGGIEAITPQPRSGGRPPGYTQEVADVPRTWHVRNLLAKKVERLGRCTDWPQR